MNLHTSVHLFQDVFTSDNSWYEDAELLSAPTRPALSRWLDNNGQLTSCLTCRATIRTSCHPKRSQTSSSASTPGSSPLNESSLNSQDCDWFHFGVYQCNLPLFSCPARLLCSKVGQKAVIITHEVPNKVPGKQSPLLNAGPDSP